MSNLRKLTNNLKNPNCFEKAEAGGQKNKNYGINRQTFKRGTNQAHIVANTKINAMRLYI